MPLPLSHETVYLDHAAATPLSGEVADAMQQAAAFFANPSSSHAAGRAAKDVLEDARERILAVTQAVTSGGDHDRDRLVFTSGATEANRLGMIGLARRFGDARGWVGISSRDHQGLHAAAGELAAAGWQRVEFSLTGRGTLDAQRILAGLPADHPTGPHVVAVTTVCGQTGIREDLTAVATLAGKGMLIHADATQAASWDDIAFADSPFATLGFAPHKFGGPRGIGGLLVRGGVALEAITPGPQELGLRGGTEAVSLAVGFATALELAAAERALQTARLGALRQRLEAGLLAAAEAAGLEALVVGNDSSRSPHVTLLALAGIDRQALAMAADLEGVCLGTGTACASGSSEPPAILAGIGLPTRFRDGAIRLSLGAATSADEIELAVARLGGVFGRFAERASSRRAGFL